MVDTLIALITPSRSRKGAWIEIRSQMTFLSRTVRRSRKGAWIEISLVQYAVLLKPVAPVRERGLKFCGALVGPDVARRCVEH